MSRRHRAEKREVLPDAKFGDVVLAKFMNSLMYHGKKSAAESIIYGAFDQMQQKASVDPLRTFHEALENVMRSSKRTRGASVARPIRFRSKSVRSAAVRSPSAGSLLPLARATRPRWWRASRANCMDAAQQPRFRRQEARRHAPDGR